MNDLQPSYTRLADRAVLRLTGPDAKPFLQGLISNDVTKLSIGSAIHAAFLTPQGKYLHDFFLAENATGLMLDGEKERLPDLKRRLGIYRLRSQVTIETADDLAVFALPGLASLSAAGLQPEAGAARSLDGGILFTDPRLAGVGGRAILPASSGDGALAALGLASVERNRYDELRLSLGLPDGSRDMAVDKSILLEGGFEELHGIDFAKGCYMGQEVTARSKDRGLVKRRLLPVAIEGTAPPPGTPLMLGDREAGEMRSSSGSRGLALLRLERFAEAQAEGRVLTAAGAKLIPSKPDWATF
jgi:folate-binding protein YgfZ